MFPRCNHTSLESKLETQFPKQLSWAAVIKPWSVPHVRKTARVFLLFSAGLPFLPPFAKAQDRWHRFCSVAVGPQQSKNPRANNQTLDSRLDESDLYIVYVYMYIHLYIYIYLSIWQFVYLIHIYTYICIDIQILYVYISQRNVNEARIAALLIVAVVSRTLVSVERGFPAASLPLHSMPLANLKLSSLSSVSLTTGSNSLFKRNCPVPSCSNCHFLYEDFMPFSAGNGFP